MTPPRPTLAEPPRAPAIAESESDKSEEPSTPLLFWRPPCVLKRVIVNLKSNPDEGLQGVLWSYHGGWIVLRQVAALVPGQQPTRVDGEVVVHRENIAYLQVLP